MSAVISSLPLPQLYYQPVSGKYWRPDSAGRWIAVDKDTARKVAIRAGYSDERTGAGLAEADECILNIQERQNVAYAASLAGRPAGIYRMDNQLVLATDSPSFVEPAAGEWPVLSQLIEGMLRTQEMDQTPYLYGWLKIALEALRQQTWAAGQLLALAGPVKGGKSLLQSVITLLLGGRSAYPYQFMTGETTFNADLFRAEHLVVDDQAESTDYRARRAFTAHIKQITASRQQRCHPKHGTPVTLEPLWRLSISLNDEPERLLVIPPLTEDLADKVMLLKVLSQPMPMPTNTPREKEAFWAALRSELPAFVQFLDDYSIPEALRNSRFGIDTYHHPDLLYRLQETAPEARLLELVDGVRFGIQDSNPWNGTASQLTAMLHGDPRYGPQARELLRNSQSCGNYLTRLCGADQSRVTSRLLQGNRIYTIQPPSTGGEVERLAYFNAREDVKIRGEVPRVAGGDASLAGQSQKSVPPVHPGPPPPPSG